PAGERLPVLTVRAHHVVVGTERGDAPHRHRLLPDVQVAEGADLSHRVGLAGALLEAADEQHHPEPVAVFLAIRGVAFDARATRSAGCHHEILAALAWSLCSQA